MSKEIRGKGFFQNFIKTAERKLRNDTLADMKIGEQYYISPFDIKLEGSDKPNINSRVLVDKNVRVLDCPTGNCRIVARTSLNDYTVLIYDPEDTLMAYDVPLIIK